MALTKTWPTQDPAGAPITDTRRVMAGLVVKNADGTPRPGIFPAHTNALVTGRASMGYDVAVFFAATSRINPGIELVANDAVTIVPTTAAPGSNSRIDVIWVRARFLQHADGSNLPEFGVTQGVAAAVPTKPTIPTGALELATAVITSTTTTTATAVITQSHPYTAAEGGVVLLRNQAEQDAWNPHDGSIAHRLDTGITYRRFAAAWVPCQSAENAFNPTFTGVTLGNGTRGGIWSYIGPNLIFLRAWVKLGTTSAVTGGVKLTLPVPASLTTTGPFDAGFTGTVNRGGVFFAPLFPAINSATEVEILAGSAGGTYLSYSPLSASAPGTWGDGALMTIAGTYRAA